MSERNESPSRRKISLTELLGYSPLSAPPPTKSQDAVEADGSATRHEGFETADGKGVLFPD
jgi:hypothetical protein